MNALSSAALSHSHESPPAPRKTSIISSPSPPTPPLNVRPKSNSLPHEDSKSPPTVATDAVVSIPKMDDIALDLRLRSPPKEMKINTVSCEETENSIEPLETSSKHRIIQSDNREYMPSARRALDFTRIDAEPVSSDNEPHSLEKVQVQVEVHEENTVDRSIYGETEEICDDPSPDFEEDNEPVSEPLEDIEAVVDDANKMIGSMHEELEAAALVFQQKCKVSDGTSTTHQTSLPYEQAVVLSKSEPTFMGDNASRNEALGLDDSNEECGEVYEDGENMEDMTGFSLPIFQTEEYINIENEALIVFNEKIREEIRLEQEEHQRLVAQWAEKQARYYMENLFAIKGINF